jgi:hypothetical protein
VNIIWGGWTGHEIFLVGSATVKTPEFKRITATEGQLFRSCSVVFRWRSCKGALLKRTFESPAALRFKRLRRA